MNFSHQQAPKSFHHQVETNEIQSEEDWMGETRPTYEPKKEPHETKFKKKEFKVGYAKNEEWTWNNETRKLRKRKVV